MQADVVVVGGGCVGASAAFHLAQLGAGRVVLVERGQVGGGPTGRTVGIVRLHYSHEPLVELARRSLERFVRFHELTGRSADFTRTGFLLLAPASELEGLAANVALQRRLGVRAEVLTPEEVARLDPRLSLEGVAGAAYEPDAGYADGYATAAGFAAAARELGVEVWEGVAAEEVQAAGGRVTGVQTSRGPVACSRVLVAAGVWTAGLLRPLGVDFPVVASREQVVQLAPPAQFGRLEVVLEDLSLGFYARPETGGTVLAGVLEEEPEEVVDPDRYNAGVDWAFVERVGSLWSKRYPSAAQAEFRGGYASIYDVTPDWQPVLGPVDGTDGLFVAAGFSGHGFKLSPALGEELARWVCGQSLSVDLRMFSLRRFSEGALLRGRHAKGLLG
ncbi:MAG: FAD-binding oxidoreductase [Armatimonadota bacterium]|nr:FAD-binding oxidoreductase [Armatimonadota bacterium]MDR5675583.1 FAD-binding oxidoreductase [Armatimonadota bacterium]MDR7388087.1 FAD-binding oxidoreductase [Armatimonadota bacterium]MDR7392780.1 FAD-binding oxidoreductase [Armatimonadota bacterium]MDR7397389.1 FAD-binding oxidoreductase [Armatimonadota bacterium]